MPFGSWGITIVHNKPGALIRVPRVRFQKAATPCGAFPPATFGGGANAQLLRGQCPRHGSKASEGT